MRPSAICAGCGHLLMRPSAIGLCTEGRSRRSAHYCLHKKSVASLWTESYKLLQSVTGCTSTRESADCVA
eukprot:8647018-Heterocapsa_arctica.AAC.1